MITLVQGDATAGPLLPPKASWIDLPVGENVCLHQSRRFQDTSDKFYLGLRQPIHQCTLPFLLCFTCLQNA